MQQAPECKYCGAVCTCPPVTVIPAAEDNQSLKREYAFEHVTNTDSIYKNNLPDTK